MQLLQQYNKILTSRFVHHSNKHGPLTKGLKYFRFGLKIRRVNRIFPKKSPRSIIYCAESVSPPRSMILRGVKPFLKTFTQAFNPDQSGMPADSKGVACWYFNTN